MTQELRELFFPYCLDRQPDGRYAVLNRDYKPVGFVVPSGTYVKYAEHPVLVRLKGLTPLQASKLAHNGSQELSRIYLYDDGSQPTGSAANWNAYAKRLQILAKLKAED